MTSTRALRALLVALAAALLALVVPATSTAAPCTITFDGGAGTSSWHDAANWTTDAVPGPSDHVCIGNVPVNYSTGDTSILSLQSQGTLELTGGSLSLTDATNASTTVNLTQSGGTLGGAGTLTVSGSFDWSGGTQTDAGTTVIASGATLSIDTAANSVFLSSGRTLRIDSGATASWSGQSGIFLGGAATIENAGTFNADGGEPDLRLLRRQRALIHNAATGTFRKSAGPGTLTVGVPFDNDGTVEAAAGTLSLEGGDAGTTTGDFNGSGADGLVRFTAGTYTLETDVSLNGRIELTNATLTVSGTVPVHRRGHLHPIRRHPRRHRHAHGLGQLQLERRHPDRRRHDRDRLRGDALDRHRREQRLPLERAHAADRLRCHRELERAVRHHPRRHGDDRERRHLRRRWRRPRSPASSPSTPLIHNAATGTFRKSAGPGTLTVGVPFDNDGTVEAAAGTLSLERGRRGHYDRRLQRLRRRRPGPLHGRHLHAGDRTSASVAAIELTNATLTVSGTVPDHRRGHPHPIRRHPRRHRHAHGLGQLQLERRHPDRRRHDRDRLRGDALDRHRRERASSSRAGARCRSTPVPPPAGAGSPASSLGGTATIENAGTFNANGGEPRSPASSPATAARSTTPPPAPSARAPGTGTLTVGVPFDNDGTVEAAAGTLSLEGGDAGTTTGDFNGSGADGLVRFTAGTYTLETDVSLSGRIELTNATLTVSGTVAGHRRGHLHPIRRHPRRRRHAHGLGQLRLERRHPDRRRHDRDRLRGDALDRHRRERGLPLERAHAADRLRCHRQLERAVRHLPRRHGDDRERRHLQRRWRRPRSPASSPSTR